MIEAGYIPAKGNYLLHVDHHDDLEAGAYVWDMTNMPKTAAEAFDFKEHCLGIADFITPRTLAGDLQGMPCGKKPHARQDTRSGVLHEL